MGLRVRPITLGLRRIVMRGTGTGRRIVIRPAATSEGGPAISERRLLPNTVGTPGQTVVVNDAGTAVEYVDAPSGSGATTAAELEVDDSAYPGITAANQEEFNDAAYAGLIDHGTAIADLGNRTNDTETAISGLEATRVTYTELTTAVDAKVADAINDGTTTVAPSQNAVFDALALKAPLASPTFTGTPAAPNAAQGTNTTQVATTAYVQTEAGLLVPKSTVTTKGDLIVATGSGAVTRRAVGTNGQVLTADSAQSDGVKWAYPSVHTQEPKYGSSDTWGIPGGDGYANFGSFSAAANTFYPIPFVVDSTITVTAIAAAQTGGATAGNMRLLVYAADVDWQATGAPLIDTGSISTATNAVKTNGSALSVVLPPGRYLRAFICDVGGLSYRVGAVARTFLSPGIDGLATRWTGSVAYGAPTSPVWSGHLGNPTPSEIMIGLRWTV